eukprot:Nk52_evm2s96 gene=Nk52_evmTU2s96
MKGNESESVPLLMEHSLDEILPILVNFTESSLGIMKSMNSAVKSLNKKYLKYKTSKKRLYPIVEGSSNNSKDKGKEPKTIPSPLKRPGSNSGASKSSKELKSSTESKSSEQCKSSSMSKSPIKPKRPVSLSKSSKSKCSEKSKKSVKASKSLKSKRAIKPYSSLKDKHSAATAKRTKKPEKSVITLKTSEKGENTTTSQSSEDTVNHREPTPGPMLTRTRRLQKELSALMYYSSFCTKPSTSSDISESANMSLSANKHGESIGKHEAIAEKQNIDDNSSGESVVPSLQRNILSGEATGLSVINASEPVVAVKEIESPLCNKRLKANQIAIRRERVAQSIPLVAETATQIKPNTIIPNQNSNSTGFLCQICRIKSDTESPERENVFELECKHEVHVDCLYKQLNSRYCVNKCVVCCLEISDDDRERAFNLYKSFEKNRAQLKSSLIKEINVGKLYN